MLKFIKMKYHHAYLLYYSVICCYCLFTVIGDWKLFRELKSEMKKNLEHLRYALFCLKFLISACEN